jgi:hypothetical protein
MPLALFVGNRPHDILETRGAPHKRRPERNPQQDRHDHFLLCGSVTLELHADNVLACARFRQFCLFEVEMREDKQQKIGVVGGGLMGHGIAYLFAAAGHRVGVFEPSPQVRASLPQRLQSIVELLDDDPRLLQRIESHDTLAPAMREAAFVFEAAPEKLALKQKVFAELESLVAPTRFSPATVLRFRPPRSAGISFIASAWSAPISGIRRIWCRWSKSSRTKRPATMSCDRPWRYCAGPGRRRSMCGGTFRVSWATGFSTQ